MRNTQRDARDVVVAGAVVVGAVVVCAFAGADGAGCDAVPARARLISSAVPTSNSLTTCCTPVTRLATCAAVSASFRVTVPIKNTTRRSITMSTELKPISLVLTNAARTLAQIVLSSVRSLNVDGAAITVSLLTMRTFVQARRDLAGLLLDRFVWHLASQQHAPLVTVDTDVKVVALQRGRQFIG